MEQKLGIGTAQFGFDYGISNRQGKTPRTEVARILALAAERGVRWLDTAPAYGVSEAVLGESLGAGHAFRVVTKTPPMNSAGRETSSRQAGERLTASFKQSLLRLRQERLYGLLFHAPADLLGPHGSALFAAALAFKQAGQIEKLGVSIYTGAEIDAVLSRFPVDLVQLPISVLDQRLLVSKHLERLAELGVEVHARSVFLQGLLLMDPDELDAGFAAVQLPLRQFRQASCRAGLSLTSAALRFVARQPQIAAVICGVNSLSQLCDLLAESAPAADRLDWSAFAVQDAAVLNPQLWKSV